MSVVQTHGNAGAENRRHGGAFGGNEDLPGMKMRILSAVPILSALSKFLSPCAVLPCLIYNESGRRARRLFTEQIFTFIISSSWSMGLMM